MAEYSGNQCGVKRYFVFDRTAGTGATQVNFITSILTTGTTTNYVSAGGATFGTTADIEKYVGNRTYLNYRRTSNRTLSSLTPDGGITNTIIEFTPDPRIQIGIFASGGTIGDIHNGFTGNHMDEIHVTGNDGNTYQAFLGRISYPETNPDIGAGKCLVDLLAYGVSGSVDPSTAFVMNAGNTIVNKTNGIETTIVGTDVINYVDINSYKESIVSQVGSSFDSAVFIGVTIGHPVAQAQNVFFNPNDTTLLNYCSRLLPAFINGASGADINKQETIFTLLAGATATLGHLDTSGENAIFGVTFNAVTGGTLGNSAFEEFAHAVIHKYAKTQNEKGYIINSIRSKFTIRDIDDISF